MIKEGIVKYIYVVMFLGAIIGFIVTHYIAGAVGAAPDAFISSSKYYVGGSKESHANYYLGRCLRQENRKPPHERDKEQGDYLKEDSSFGSLSGDCADQ